MKYFYLLLAIIATSLAWYPNWYIPEIENSFLMENCEKLSFMSTSKGTKLEQKLSEILVENIGGGSITSTYGFCRITLDYDFN